MFKLLRVLVVSIILIAFVGIIFAVVKGSGPPPSPASSSPSMPGIFTIQQRFFSIGHVFDLKSSDGNFGTVEEQFLTWGRTFEYLDNSRHLVATGKAKVFTLGAQIDVVDGYGKPLGTIKEEILNSLFKVYTTYDILDPSGSVLLKSKKTEFFSVDFDVQDPAGHVVATMTRPAFNWLGHSYTVHIHDQNAVDSRMLIMIAAFKTASDSDKAHHHSSHH